MIGWRRIPNFDDHWNFTKGDWYDYDPYSDFKNSPEWYAPDLIEKILNQKSDMKLDVIHFPIYILKIIFVLRKLLKMILKLVLMQQKNGEYQFEVNGISRRN